MLAIPVWVATKNAFAAHNVRRTRRLRPVIRLHVAAGPAAHRRRRCRRDVGSALRLLPVRVRPYRAHPALDDGGHSPQPPCFSPAGRWSIGDARTGAGTRAWRPGNVLCVLRCVRRNDGRICHALLRLVETTVDVGLGTGPRLLSPRSHRSSSSSHSSSLTLRSRKTPALPGRSTIRVDGPHSYGPISRRGRAPTPGCCRSSVTGTMPCSSLGSWPLGSGLPALPSPTPIARRGRNSGDSRPDGKPR